MLTIFLLAHSILLSNCNMNIHTYIQREVHKVNGKGRIERRACTHD